MRIPLLFFLSCVGFTALIVTAAFFLFPPPSSLSSLDYCFPSTATSQPSGPDESCLKKRVDSLLRTYSTSELMNHLVASTTPYAVTSYCHDAAHVIGEATFIKYDRVEASLGQCTRACNFGCIHGVIAAAVAKDLGGRYLTEDIVHADPVTVEKLGRTYCAKGLCHAIGHILYIGSNTIKDALRSCENIGSSATVESCYQGVFMEASDGAEVFVKRTKTPSRNDSDYAYPCDAISSQYDHACFQYLTNFQRQLFAKNNVPIEKQFNIVRTVCESFTDKKTRSDCFVGIGYIFLRTLDNRTSISPRSPTLCESLPGTDQDSCIVGLALKNALSDEYVNALDYCSRRNTESRIALCYNVVFQTMKNVWFSDGTIATQCDSSSAASECKKQFRTYLTFSSSLPNYFQKGLF